MVQVHLPRSRVQQIATAHHMGNTLLGIIHCGGQLVGRQIIFSVNHKITSFLRHEVRLWALNAIVKNDVEILTDNSDRGGRVGLQSAVAADAWVDVMVLELQSRAGAVIGLLLAKQASKYAAYKPPTALFSD